MKEMKDLYNGNYKSLKKDGRIFHAHRSTGSIL
jgi:hypothetical protein